MKNVLYLETCTTHEDYKKTSSLRVSLESFIVFYVYKYCSPSNINLYFKFTNSNANETYLEFNDTNINYINLNEIPWQAELCLYPVVLCVDTIITGLCAVSRHICKYRSSTICSKEHKEGLLGFRKSCLQAPNEVSIWTKFCEIDIPKTVSQIINTDILTETPINLVHFENHLNKPVKIHNVYKLARDLKKEVKLSEDLNEKNNVKSEKRVSKQRKWKSNLSKQIEVDCSIKIEDLNISHQFSEGPFLTLADLVLLPSYYIIIKRLGNKEFQSLFPLTYKWFINMSALNELNKIENILKSLNISSIEIKDIILPATDDKSLYKLDKKRHNPKKRLFTKPEDIENALVDLEDGLELEITTVDHQDSINWSEIPDGANPFAGHLPDTRNSRKSQQLENLTLAVLKMAKDNDIIVDFCSGSGHLGILIAHLLPKATVILLENKEQSLIRARERVHNMGLRNIYFFQCNLDFFVGTFDIGVALHACGIASDLVLDKCLKASAKFVICPCCYGSLHITDRLVYPRSIKYRNLSIKKYLCICHTADQTHKNHPLTVRGSRCMAVIDSDRARLAEEHCYKVTLSRLKPLTCTDKNNLLIGVPS